MMQVGIAAGGQLPAGSCDVLGPVLVQLQAIQQAGDPNVSIPQSGCEAKGISRRS
jgi:hypothetical protein